MDPTGWWLSEKLDGVRAYWDGTRLLSRTGIRYWAPDWFLAALPAELALDGELGPGDAQLNQGEYYDEYPLEAEAGDVIEADLTSADFDTYLVVLAPSGAAEIAKRLPRALYIPPHLESTTRPHPVWQSAPKLGWEHRLTLTPVPPRQGAWYVAPTRVEARLLVGLRASYERDLRRAGGGKTLRRFFADKALLAFAAPFVVLAPYAAATGRLPSLALVVLLAIAGSFVPDLLLRQQVKQRREAIFLDLPEMIAVLSLSLGAGQSLRQALERRLDKLPEDPARDRLSTAQVARVQGELDDLRRRVPPSPELEQLRWSVEELRISLFAQPMKTRFPVSETRLYKAMDALLP